jgi:hypothetical protein
MGVYLMNLTQIQELYKTTGKIKSIKQFNR